MSHARFFVVLQDETAYWQDENLIDRCGGKIQGVHFFDANRHVHCCELTPSYELYFLESVPQGAVSEEDHDTLMEANLQTPEVSYIHVGSIDLDECILYGSYTEEEWESLVEDFHGDEEKAYYELVEEVRESISGNPIY